jgi:hypothetical protein
MRNNAENKWYLALKFQIDINKKTSKKMIKKEERSAAQEVKSCRVGVLQIVAILDKVLLMNLPIKC